MKEKPILFNTEMVKAILEGHKTETRRPVKPQPISEGVQSFGESWQWVKGSDWFSGVTTKQLVSQQGLLNRSPFGQIGDRLYVRETFVNVSIFTSDDQGKMENINDVGPGERIKYKADGDLDSRCFNWKPSIHMPKKYARIFLEITDLRVERVRDITEEQAKAEGIISNEDYEDNAGSEDLFNCPMCSGMQVHGCLGENMGVSECDCRTCDTQKKRFSILWDSVYPDSWENNQWVWVVKFKRVEK